MTAAKTITAATSIAVGLWIGSTIFLTILAHAAEYTAVGRDNTGEMVLVEFDECWLGFDSTYNAEPEAEE